MQKAGIRKTYAHKKSKGRNAHGNGLDASSSPLQDLGQEELVSRPEMTRRMLKRSRRSAEAPRVLADKDTSGRHDNLEHAHKKLRHSAKIQNGLNALSNFMDYEMSINLDDPSSFETPYPSVDTERFRLMSSVGSYVAPEEFSPVPVARRMLSRTSSRDLKENASRNASHSRSRKSSRARGLASPFNSRPGSAASSPKSRSKTRYKPRPLLKTRTLSDNKSQSRRQREPTFSLNHSAANSPQSKNSGIRVRRPSVPSTSYMLDQINKEDWLVPPKALSRDPLTDAINFDRPPSELGFCSPTSFFGDFPQAFSTPHRALFLKDSQLNDPFEPSSGQASPEMNEDEGDVIMGDGTITFGVPFDTTDSIFSKDSLFSSTIAAQSERANALNKVSLSNYNIELNPSSSLNPTTPEHDSSNRLAKGPKFKESAITMGSLTSSPIRFAPSPAPLDDPSLAAHPAWSVLECANAFDPVIRSRPPSPMRTQISAPSPPSPSSESLKDLFSSLGIAGQEDFDNPDDSGISMGNIQRSRSLDSPAEIVLSKPTMNKRTRDRRGTIRASDFQPSASRANLGSARRTRSGTVIGPPAKAKAISPVKTRRISNTENVPQSVESESEDELDILKNSGRDETWLGTGALRTNLRGDRLPEVESDDELRLLPGDCAPFY